MAYGIAELASVCVDSLSQLELVTNNIANLATSGFKAELWRRSTPDQFDASSERASATAMYVDYSQGIVQQTGNALDLAIQGEGFFVVETPEGSSYTRKGNFTLDKDNRLVTHSGYPVLGENGQAISINGKTVEIDQDGVVQVDGNEAARLKFVQFENQKELIRRGDGLFSDSGNAGIKKAENAVISSRHLELANVNAIKEMVNMIDIQRTFESYQKAILTIAEMDKLSTSRVGRLA